MRRLLLLVAVLAATPGAALAAEPVEGAGARDAATDAAPAGTEAGVEPAPQPGQMTFRTKSGIRLGSRRYVMRGQQVTAHGFVRPFVADQEATVEIRRGGRLVDRVRRPIEQVGQYGRFTVRFKPRSRGRYALLARHEATPQQQAFRAPTVSLRSVSPSAGRGDRGTEVRLLHRGLRRLAYVAPGGRRFTSATKRAVIAFRKVNRMARTGRASRRVYARLLRGEGGFRLRRGGRGRHVEFDWSRQVLVLATGDKVRRIYHASSGKASTPTPFGGFSFYRKDRGRNSVGMVHSSYFHFGYAIHGYHSVPTHPASHGCIRVPIPNALSIFRWIDLGDPIYIYR